MKGRLLGNKIFIYKKIVAVITAMVVVLFCLFNVNALVQPELCSSDASAVQCSEAITLPILDGEIDAIWDTTPAYSLSYLCGTTYNALTGSYFKLLWAPDAIYLLVNARDATKRESDQVNVFFRELDTSQEDCQMLQISFSRMGNGVAQIAYENTDTVYAVQEDGSGYVLEWRLPRERGGATVKDEAYVPGDKFQINVTIDDDVNALPGREYYISYLEPAENPANPSEDQYVWWYVNGVTKSTLPAIVLAEGQRRVAAEALAPISIDGVIDMAWSQTPAYEIVHQDIDVQNQVAGSYFKMLWDADYLYYLVNVKDTTPRAGDGVSIFFREMDLEQKGTQMLQVFFPRGGSSTEIAYENTPTSYAIKEYSDGYILEWALPRERGAHTVCGTEFRNGHRVQVNVVIDDDCATPDGREYYASYLKPTDSPNRIQENEYLWWYMSGTEKSRLPSFELIGQEAAGCSIRKAAGAPTIDGIIEPVWLTAEAYPLTYLTGAGPNGLQGSYFKLLWDETGLYFLVYAKDTTPFTADQVGIYFREKDGEESDVRLLQAMFLRDGDTTEIAYENTEVSYAVEEYEDGYVLEWKLPRERGYNTVQEQPYQIGDSIQVNVVIDDDRNEMVGRENYLSYLKPAGNPLAPQPDEYVWWYTSGAQKSRLPAFTLKGPENAALQRIVVPQNASSTEETAAQELQTHLWKCLEVMLPICTDSMSYMDGEVLIGHTNRAGVIYAQTDADLGTDGYRLLRVGNTIGIAGGGDRGTLYGVYSFLELFFGCRWYSSEVTVTPNTSCDMINIPANLDRIDVPVLEYRNVDWFDTFDAETAARLRINCAHNREEADSLPYGGVMSFAGGDAMFCHTFHSLVPAETYFTSHPEYFSLNEVNGQLVRTTNQLCLTNADVLDIVIQKVKDMLEDNPQTDIVSITQNDVVAPCICSECALVDTLEGSQSGTMIRFVNAVADSIREDYPNVRVMTLAYFYSSVPPEITAPRDNVIINLATARNCCTHPFETDTNHEATAAFRQKLAGWEQISNNLYIWDYTTDFGAYLMTFPNLRTLGANLRYLASNGVKGMTAQGNFQDRSGEFGELRAYLLSKLMWNPYIDENAVIYDFMQGYYGDGWRSVLRYIDEFHDAAQDHHLLSTIQNSATEVLPVVSRTQTETFIRKMEAYWNMALNEASPAQSAQVSRSSIQILFYKQVVTRDWYYVSGNSEQRQQWLTENAKLFSLMKTHEVDSVRENIRIGDTVDLTAPPDKWR